MTRSNVASQKMHAHGLIHELGNLFSEAGELATTLVGCLHRVVPARRFRVAAGLDVCPLNITLFSLSAFPICPRISLVVQCDRASLVVLILAGLLSCSSSRCFSSSLAMRLVVSCLNLLPHQNYGTEIVMMFSFLICLRLFLSAAGIFASCSRTEQNNVFVLTA